MYNKNNRDKATPGAVLLTFSVDLNLYIFILYIGALFTCLGASDLRSIPLLNSRGGNKLEYALGNEANGYYLPLQLLYLRLQSNLTAKSY